MLASASRDRGLFFGFNPPAWGEGKAKFATWVNRFGFGRDTGVDLPGEERGIVPLLARYSGTSMVNLPIGQGLAVTPMQMAAAYAAIANGGKLVTPHVVSKVGGIAVERRPVRRVISSQVARQLRIMLKGVFDPTGTAAEVSIPSSSAFSGVKERDQAITFISKASAR